jgi:predicted RNase H-like HicB family nuclease
MNDLAHYLTLRYRVVLTPDEDGWIATIPDLPGCMAVGENPDESLHLLDDARRSWIEASLAKGLPIPAPQDYRVVET